MASTLAPLSPSPPPGEPIVDPKTGRLSTTWTLYLQRLDQHVREIEQRLAAIGA